MEVHEQHKYVAIDSGASSHFYPNTYEGTRHDSTAATIRVGCANKGVMKSLAKDIIYFDKLPLAAKKCHKFKQNLAATVLRTTIMQSKTHCYFQR